MKKIPFTSVVLAVHNEAENLGKCLDAVTNIADEIVIVDGASTDNTVEIAELYNANIIKTDNKPNFHINKQIAIDAAKGTLIVQLDADEILDAELIASLQKLINQLKNHSETEIANLPTKGWQLARKNFFLGHFLTKGGQYPDYVIRVFINSYGKLPQKDVHEQIAIDGGVETLPGHLLHYSNPSFKTYLRKWNTYTSLEAEHQIKAGFKPNFGSFLQFFMVKPLATFFGLYLRHRGYVDGIAGFMFAKMSAIFHIVVFIKAWEIYANRRLA